MARKFLSLLAICMLAASSLAQNAQDSFATLQANANLVLVDVVVLDKDKNPIHGLHASDFVLYEDGALQHIKAFEEHSASASAVIKPNPPLPPGFFTNITTTPAGVPLNILLLDKLNTPLRDQSNLRLQLLKYLDTVKPGTRIALFELTSQLNLIQGFTDDRALLRTALKDKDRPMLPLAGENISVVGDGPANVGRFEGSANAQRSLDRGQITLDALQSLSLYLADIPGRKNLLWFSADLPATMFPTDDADISAVSQTEFRNAANLLTANQVAIYPVDDRALSLAPINGVAVDGEQYVRRPEVMSDSYFNFGTNLDEVHNAMREIARQTGGRAFFETNNLDQIAATAIGDGSNYYTLAYDPANTDWNGGYRKIVVHLERPKITLSYRRGYYANRSMPDQNATPQPVIHPSEPASRIGAMRLAVVRGAPDSTQIAFSARILPTGSAAQPALTPGNEAAKDVHGPYLRYTIDFGVDPAALTFTPYGDHYRGTLEFVTLVYDTAGNSVIVAGNPAYANFNRQEYEKISRVGIPYHQEVSVPVKGDYYLRILVHDIPTDRVGSIEVPLSAINKLPAK